ncbi:UNVERIFIED_CONTAM: hypothetical protein Slati_2314300 [Sesamum latifolium]|uniref:Uncharacterized protein n=1 Tax=Sesamum latifolium TaxID=2727402 RepID=A0AAW2W9G7_9LAMI
MAAFHSRSKFSIPISSSNGCCRRSSVQAKILGISININHFYMCKHVSLRDLHEGLNNLIQMPSVQQALSQGEGENWVNELLDESLRLVDLCGFSRDVVCLTKESIQDLESSIRRNGGEKATGNDINAYVASRKKINKMVNKCIKNLKSSNQSSTPLPAIGTMLKETEALDFSVLKSVLILLSGRRKDQSKEVGRCFPSSPRPNEYILKQSKKLLRTCAP